MNITAWRDLQGDAPFSVADASEALGIRSPGSTLNRLKAQGIIERVGRGQYRFAPPDRWPAIDARLEWEQVMAERKGREDTIAELAWRTWRSDLDSGRIVATGPRTFRWRLSMTRPEGLRVRRA